MSSVQRESYNFMAVFVILPESPDPKKSWGMSPYFS